MKMKFSFQFQRLNGVFEMKNFFITGTDTGVGKTTVSVALLRAFQKQGHTTAAMKPLATGCVLQNGLWVSEDNQQLQAAATAKQTSEYASPFYFGPPTAPSLAATFSGVALTAKKITNYIQDTLKTISCDVVLIEGVGGWQVPLNEHETMADVVSQLDFPVILVAGLRLGCINHALLTYKAIQAKGLSCVGWVANRIDPSMLYVEETIETIKKNLPVSCLGVLPYRSQVIQTFASSLCNL